MPPVDMTMGFPFSAVYGMDDAKRAIECALVNPRIRTVLIRGGPGSAKTVLARAAGRFSGKRLVNIPLNVTEEQLFGGMDIDATIREGRPVVQKGLLARADGGILYVDDVNLLDQRVLASLLDCVLTGRVVLEREGVSAEYQCETVMIATMNPSDSDISTHLLDRFDLCAYSDFPEEGEGRTEVLHRNIEYQKDPEVFNQLYGSEENSLKETVERAKMLLPLVMMSDDLMGVAVELASKVLADGFRGDIAMINTSMALAALNGRDEVLRKDVEEAAMICLAHRRNYIPDPPQPPEPPEEPQDQDEKEDDQQDNDDQQQDQLPEPPQQDRNDQDEGQQDQQPPEPPNMDDIQQMLDEMMFEIGEQFRVIDYLDDGRRVIRTTSSRKGRRAMVESNDATGRYARSRPSDEKVHDIAFDATIRAAAPYQKGREHDGLSISIHPQDVREKVRERRSGCTIMFLVDASGSLGVRKRMAAVKGAVLSMLRDSYVKRDRIGMMAFRRDSAELILPPTKSVEYSYKKLEELPTGGKTPLGEALVTVNEFMTSYSRSHPGESCYIVLITDGRANVPLKQGADANEEVRKLASEMAIPQVKWIVIDASAGYIRFDNAEKLAMELEGTYFRLEDLNADRLAESVRAAIR
ncbi:MAG: VWA domain-containing protein [Candidatus Methanomethylophilaceae archaeon]|nr:VWA domain-containing protein [Candidatus Methanomethylophilaceae archaeon]